MALGIAVKCIVILVVFLIHVVVVCVKGTSYLECLCSWYFSIICSAAAIDPVVCKVTISSPVSY